MEYHWKNHFFKSKLSLKAILLTWWTDNCVVFWYHDASVPPPMWRPVYWMSEVGATFTETFKIMGLYQHCLNKSALFFLYIFTAFTKKGCSIISESYQFQMICVGKISTSDRFDLIFQADNWWCMYCNLKVKCSGNAVVLIKDVFISLFLLHL